MSSHDVIAHAFLAFLVTNPMLMIVQCPKLPVIGSTTERPHAGLIHPAFIHGRCASQSLGPVVASPVLQTQ